MHPFCYFILNTLPLKVKSSSKLSKTYLKFILIEKYTNINKKGVYKKKTNTIQKNKIFQE